MGKDEEYELISLFDIFPPNPLEIKQLTHSKYTLHLRSGKPIETMREVFHVAGGDITSLRNTIDPSKARSRRATMSNLNDFVRERRVPVNYVIAFARYGVKHPEQIEHIAPEDCLFYRLVYSVISGTMHVTYRSRPKERLVFER